MMKILILPWAFPGNLVKKMAVLSLLLDERESSSFEVVIPNTTVAFLAPLERKQGSSLYYWVGMKAQIPLEVILDASKDARAADQPQQE